MEEETIFSFRGDGEAPEAKPVIVNKVERYFPMFDIYYNYLHTIMYGGPVKSYQIWVWKRRILSVLHSPKGWAKKDGSKYGVAFTDQTLFIKNIAIVFKIEDLRD